MSLRTCSVLAAITMAASVLVAACSANPDKTTSTGDGGGGAAGAGGIMTGSGAAGAAGAAGSAGSGATGGTAGAGGTTMSTTPTGCVTNADCAMSTKGSICGPDGECVACLPASDPVLDCGVGKYCSTNTGQCEAGCSGDADCTDASTYCDVNKHACIGCTSDANCAPGTICVNDQCQAGCNDMHACAAGDTCCGSSCVDLAKNVDNCGMCNNSCPQLPNALPTCSNGQCVVNNCLSPFKDCNGKSADGCETNTLIDGECKCNAGKPDIPDGCDENLAGKDCICKVQPNSPLCICYVDPGSPACAKDNEKQDCYLGDPNTVGIGVCKVGTRMCKDSGIDFGPCLGQVLPAPEICGNGLDDNCNGTTDEAVDVDKDGWSTCEGDCNDYNPNVNPGAFEVTYSLLDDDGDPMTPPIQIPGGNGVDDDCDPLTLDKVEPPPCSTAEKLTGVSADDLRRAIDICQTTTLNPPKPQRKPGLISAELKLGNGNTPSGQQLNNMYNKQAAILTQFGWKAPMSGINFCKSPQQPNNPPHKGPTMAGISTGLMRYVGQDSFVPQSGGASTDLASGTACPAAYLAAHANKLPSSSGCNGMCPTGNSCNDSINLRMVMRVPSNAKGFSYDFRFWSTEFPEWVCQNFNDFYLALLTSTKAGLPPDKNVSFDGLGNPLSVNNGFFDVCQSFGCFACGAGIADLDCTGMETGKGGGTSWLTTDAPVEPGETITLELMVFDVQDNFFDSHALIDNFRWQLNAVLGTHN